MLSPAPPPPPPHTPRQVYIFTFLRRRLFDLCMDLWYQATEQLLVHYNLVPTLYVSSVVSNHLGKDMAALLALSQRVNISLFHVFCSSSWWRRRSVIFDFWHPMEILSMRSFPFVCAIIDILVIPQMLSKN